VYACAQKNLGIAGMSLVIVRRDLLDRALPETPAVFNYAHQDKNNSLACTPTTVSWYVASLILDWIETQGGIEAMTHNSLLKSQLVYDCIDSSDVFSNKVHPACRSRINIPFTLNDTSRENAFFEAAYNAGFLNLKGHRSVGGVRVSLYNAVAVVDVERLVDFLRSF
jgi:phosphoserine aminotransferase